MTVTLPLIKDTFYDLVIEFKELQYDASLKLEWESPRTQREVVPSKYLFSA
jgi:hypothetical protein